MTHLQQSTRLLFRLMFVPFIVLLCLVGLIVFDESTHAEQNGSGSGPLTWGTSGLFAPAGLLGNIVTMQLDTQGNINILSHYLDSSQNDALYLSRRTAAGVWLPTERIDNGGQQITSPRIAIDAGGNVHVIWFQDVELHPNVQQQEVLYNKRTSGGWGIPQIISTHPVGYEHVQYTLGLSLATNDQGDIIVGWVAQIQLTPQNFYNYALITRFKPVGGDWEPYQLANPAFAQSDNTSALALQMDGAGNSYLTWTIGYTSPYQGVYFNFQPYGRSWGNASKITVNGTPVNLYWNDLYLTPEGELFGLFSIGTFVWTTRTTTGEWQVVSNIPTVPNDPYGCDLTGDSLVLNAQRHILMLRTCQRYPEERRDSLRLLDFKSRTGGSGTTHERPINYRCRG